MEIKLTTFYSQLSMFKVVTPTPHPPPPKKKKNQKKNTL